MSESVWGDSETQYFFELTPEIILDAIESLGFKTTTRVLTLNSMENRVYEVEVEREESELTSPSDHFIIAKFYRPGRWSQKQIAEEHQFLLDLAEEEVPVIAPMVINGETVFTCKQTNLFFTIFPKKGGRAPDEMNREQLQILGRQLARLHGVGCLRKASHRLEINPETFGAQNLLFLQSSQTIPMHFEKSYTNLVTELLDLIKPKFNEISTHRIHGDCHLGNIIHREDEGFFFIDFDDMLIGPAVQDIWLIVPGRDQEALINRDTLLEAYTSMRDFDYKSLELIEPLRALRYIHFTAWIAKRWEDPSFKNAFPYFGDESYWERQMNDLREQLNLIGANR